ncbi:MAG: hypothetical protein D6721_05795, partial [Gammaproteobacteria bacterium]
MRLAIVNIRPRAPTLLATIPKVRQVASGRLAARRAWGMVAGAPHAKDTTGRETMQETLLIRCARGGHPEVEYAVVDPEGRLLTPPQQAPLDTLAAQARDRQVVALAPAEAVVLVETRVPTRSRARLRQAVPYAVEEFFTQDVETLHFAFDVPDAEGRLRVAAVDRAEMQAWVRACEAREIAVPVLLPEPLAVPEPAGEAAWSLLWSPGHWVLRDRAGTAYGGRPEEWPGIAAWLAAGEAAEAG